MRLDYFSPARGNLAVKLQARGQVVVHPGTEEHQAALELVAFGRAYQVPGTADTFGQERRAGKRA